MRKGILTLLIINLFIGAFCQDNAEWEQEEKAIKKMLYEEGKRFSAYDMESKYAYKTDIPCRTSRG